MGFKAIGDEMKMKIAWHEEFFENSRIHYEKRQASVRNDLIRLEEYRKELDFYALQIEGAKRRKKDGFDRNKFMKFQKTKEERNEKNDM